MSSIDNFIKELGGNFISLVKSIGVLDVFDIILVAVLIYYAFNFLRNRRAGKLVFGVVILFALQLLSDLLGLVATQFILQNVLQLGLIALLILFQPELRSALEKMGGSGAQRGVKWVRIKRLQRSPLSPRLPRICRAIRPAR